MSKQDKNLGEVQPAQDKTFPVGGFHSGEHHYSIRNKGYQWGEVATVLHIEIVRDGEMLKSEVATPEGKEALKSHVQNLELLPADADWLCKLIDSVEV